METAAKPAGRSSDKTVLIVDDDESIRELLKVVVRRAGFKHLEARTGEEAIGSLTHKPDAILLDLIMPGCGGLGVLRRLKTDSGHSPVVFALTAYDNRHPAVLEAVMDKNVRQMFLKPLDLDAILHALHLQLGTVPAAAKAAAAASTIEDNDFFIGFRNDSKTGLIACAQSEELSAGTVLFVEGDPADFLYLVCDGEVELVKDSKDGPSVVLAAVKSGDFFGELGVLGYSGRNVGARAKGRVRLSKIPCAEVRRALGTESPQVWMQLLKRMLGYLRATNERVMSEVVHKGKIQLIGEMAGSIIHDFRNPLAGIQLAARVIMEEHPDAPMTNECCQIILQQSDRMVGMAQELLEFSRGRPKLELKKLSVTVLFDTFKQLNEQYLKESSVRLVLEPVDAAMDLDLDRFLRVLQNLVGNSVDAMGPAGGEIRLGAAVLDRGVEISVADNGPGIPEGIRHRIFEPFFTHGKMEGTGLGMTITKTLVEAHGGEITFSTETGKGTTFRIRLPAAA